MLCYSFSFSLIDIVVEVEISSLPKTLDLYNIIGQFAQNRSQIQTLLEFQEVEWEKLKWKRTHIDVAYRLAIHLLLQQKIQKKTTTSSVINNENKFRAIHTNFS